LVGCTAEEGRKRKREKKEEEEGEREGVRAKGLFVFLLIDLILQWAYYIRPYFRGL
jgi:hypothetical protein